MRTVSARHPTHPLIQFMHGRLAVQADAFSEAETAFRAVAADKRTAALGWYYTAATQFLEGRPRDAAVSMRRCLEAHPPAVMAAYAWTAMAYYHSVSGKHGEAIRASQQGTKPRSEERLHLGRQGFLRGKWQAVPGGYRPTTSTRFPSTGSWPWLSRVWGRFTCRPIGPATPSLP